MNKLEKSSVDFGIRGRKVSVVLFGDNIATSIMQRNYLQETCKN